MHALLLKLHRWTGLIVGIVVFIVAVTGSILVFEADLDRQIHRPLALVAPGPSRVSLESALAAVKEANPSAAVTGIAIPQEPTHTLLLTLKGTTTAASIDPYSGRYLGTWDRAAGIPRWVHLLHTRLVAGEAGEMFVGAVTALTFLMAVSGVVLWWPRKVLGVKGGRPWRRVNFDLHNVLGFYSSLFLVFITLSGVIIAFEKYTDPLIMKLDSAPPPPAEVFSQPVPGGRRISLDDAVRIANEALPGAMATNVNVPTPGKTPFRLIMKFPEDRTPAGRSRVTIDQYSGRVLQVVSTRAMPVGSKILALKRSIHTGDLFGAPTQALAFVVSLALAGQVVTGFLIWWKPGKLAFRTRAVPARDSGPATTTAS
jgi:uncharacterized iron-regulated membrane protein